MRAQSFAENMWKEFGKLDFSSISKLIFAGYKSSKNQVRSRLKIQFVELNFSKSIFQNSTFILVLSNRCTIVSVLTYSTFILFQKKLFCKNISNLSAYDFTQLWTKSKSLYGCIFFQISQFLVGWARMLCISRNDF